MARAALLRYPQRLRLTVALPLLACWLGASWYKMADEVSGFTSIFQAGRWEEGVWPAQVSF